MNSLWPVMQRTAVAACLCSASVFGASAAANDAVERDCVITPSALVEVSTAVPGVLDSVYVERSDIVAKGQPLAQLDARVEQVDRDVAKQRTDMEASIKLRQVNVKFDKRRLKRISKMEKVVSEQEKDKAAREASLSAWRLKEAKDVLRQRELELKRAEAVLSRRQITSPTEGIVVERLRHPGEYVEEQPIVRIARLDPLYVEVIVPMSEFGAIKPGMKAVVVPETAMATQLNAEVDVVDGMGDAASGTFGVRLTLANPDHKIPAGVKCRVSIQSEGAGAQGEITMQQ